MSKARDIADLNTTILDSVESGATADQTNAEIRAAVEAATDSNVFTDADHTKLNSGVATVVGSETLTNKTLTSPDINTPDIDGGTIDGTVIGAATPADASVTSLAVDTITIDGSEIDASGSLTLDVGGNLTINVDGSVVSLADDSVNFGQFFNSGSGDFNIYSPTSNKDIVFRGSDGGTGIIAVTLDMSDSGAAIFNSTVTAAKLVSTNGVLELDDNGSHNGVINVPAGLFVNIDSNSSSTNETFRIAKDRTGTNGGTELFKLHEDGNLEMRAASNVRISLGTAGTSGANNNSNWIYGNGNNLRFNNAGGFYSWETTGTERMRLSAGALRINGSTGYFGEKLTITSSTSYTQTSVRTGTGNEGHIAFRNANGAVGTIFTNGSATSYNTSSDYRLKENVVAMTGSIDRVKALKPSRFNFIVDADITVDGFLAHEAQAVVPECVTGTKDAMMDEEYEVTAAVEEVRDADDNITTEATEAVMGTRSVPDMQGIDQSKLVPLLVSALQEAVVKIEELTARITALEGE